MKRFFFSAISFLILVFYSPNGAIAQADSRRLISMSPSITEILFELGAGDQVVGVTDFCSWPEKVKALPKIGGLINPSFETMVSLQPDLVILQHDRNRLIKRLDALHLKTLPVNLEKLEDILDSILIIGRAIGKEDRAVQLREKLIKRITFFKIKLKGAPKKTTLILLGDSSNPYRDLYAVGKSTFLDQLLSLGGGENILDDSWSDYPRVSKEFILSSSPQFIIEANPHGKLSPSQKDKRSSFWDQFQTLQAVKERNIHYIGAEFILIPGPRFFKIVEAFAQVLHPELFESSMVEGSELSKILVHDTLY